MEIPKPGGSKAVLLTACAATGHVLNNEGGLYRRGGADLYRIIDSLEEAEQIALRELRSGLVELVLYDDQGNHVRTYRPERPVTPGIAGRPLKGNFWTTILQKMKR